MNQPFLDYRYLSLLTYILVKMEAMFIYRWTKDDAALFEEWYDIQDENRWAMEANNGADSPNQLDIMISKAVITSAFHETAEAIARFFSAVWTADKMQVDKL